MGRKPNLSARPYDMSTAAKLQRQKAIKDRWLALEGASKEERTLPGRPRKLVKPTATKRKSARISAGK